MVEVIKKIKQAEEEGKRIIEEAKLRAKEIVQEAEYLGEKTYAKLLEAKRNEAEAIKEWKREEGNTAARLILQNGKKQTEEIKETAEKNVSNAIDYIIERIVMKNGHR